MNEANKEEFGTKAWFENKFKTINQFGDGWGHGVRSSQMFRIHKSTSLLNYLISNSIYENLLDIGCGVCDYLKNIELQKKIRYLYGCDISENAINYNKKTFPNMQFSCQSLPEVKYDTETFDIVSALEVLNYLNSEDRLKALQEIKRVIKSNGYFLFSGSINSGPEYFDEKKILFDLQNLFKIEKVLFCHLRYYLIIEKLFWGIIVLNHNLKNPNAIPVKSTLFNFVTYLNKFFILRIFISLFLFILSKLSILIISNLKITTQLEAFQRIFLNSSSKSNILILCKKI